MDHLDDSLSSSRDEYYQKKIKKEKRENMIPPTFAPEISPKVKTKFDKFRPIDPNVIKMEKERKKMENQVARHLFD